MLFWLGTINVFAVFNFSDIDVKCILLTNMSIDPGKHYVTVRINLVDLLMERGHDVTVRRAVDCLLEVSKAAARKRLSIEYVTGMVIVPMVRSSNMNSADGAQLARVSTVVIAPSCPGGG
jgi:hypothetical protein